MSHNTVVQYKKTKEDKCTIMLQQFRLAAQCRVNMVNMSLLQKWSVLGAVSLSTLNHGYFILTPLVFF